MHGALFVQHSKMQCSLIDEGIFGLHHLPVAHTLVIVDTVRQVMPKALLIHHIHSAPMFSSAASLSQV